MPGGRSIQFGGSFKAMLLLLIFSLCFRGQPAGQPADTIRSLSREDAVRIATENNLKVRNARLRARRAGAMQGSAESFRPTRFNYFRGQIHSPANRGMFTISQSIQFPLVTYYQNKSLKERHQLRQKQVESTRREIARDTKIAYNHWVFLHHKSQLLHRKLQIYKNFQRIAHLRSQQGATTRVEKTTADTKLYKAQNAIHQVYQNIARAENRLSSIMNTQHQLLPQSDTLKIYRIDYTPAKSPDQLISPLTRQRHQKKIRIQDFRIKARKADLFPDITAGYFNQTISGHDNLDGWHVGLSLPLWFGPQKSRIRQAQINKQIAQNTLQQKITQQQTKIQNLSRQLNHLREQLSYYHNQALKKASLLAETSKKRYKSQDISYSQYMESLETAYGIRKDYLRTIKSYNKTAIRLEFYIH